jgi:hypothetical protein
MKKLISSTIMLTLIALVLSCGSSTKKDGQQVQRNKRQFAYAPDDIEVDDDEGESNLLLTDFNRLPEDIKGCSCYFSETPEKFKKEEYFFAASFDSIGFVAVNNMLTELKLISTTREADTFGDNDHVAIYRSELYKVTVAIKYKKSNGDETWWNDGTITIENKNGKKYTKKFVGECGC